jgi:hypothetical protein
MSEKNAGQLRSLTSRTQLLREWTSVQLADFYHFVRTYRQLMNEQTKELIPAYFEHQRRVPIATMYVEPTFLANRTRSLGFEASDPVSFDELVDTCFRTVVLGDPGAGKSTLARKIAHELSSGDLGTAGNSKTVPFLVQGHGKVLQVVTAPGG